jgi:micrococcal nuclease
MRLGRLVFAFCFFTAITIGAQTFKGKVITIKDGDTVVVLDSINKSTTLRLAEIDCPEKKQPFGNKAKIFTHDQIYLKTITYVITDIDRYGRAIAMLYYGSENKYLSAELVKNGLAWHYKRYSKSTELANLELQAKKNRIGIWSQSNPMSPSEWRNN